MNTKVKDMVILAFLTAILLVGQVGMAFLHNIEVVSLLIIIYTLLFRKKVFYIIYIFAFLEGMIYGFGIWWFMYLYVWTILAVITMLCSKNDSPVMWSIISGAFGLGFGFLCSFPYFIISGVGGGIAYWISGIPSDILHCVGNVVITLVLFKPVYGILSKLTSRYYQRAVTHS
ncbi:hypothetical protein GKG47_16945 [Lactonifactor sp. BIOML-A3]|uniref:hypothetical protein n=1 Tax=Lactonifactor TaxID=420345 RepID=UPI0012AF34D6|nr:MULTISPECIES: hypothetical protein [Lactonifactor]MCB5714466.1 hypothetical protein [Lactonifactor longoviformis]MCB5718420.1 hypothetical protein [Lactonifactor longoviformis]MSA02531.1 hypothetical protein [Lactonifactor sp. BIOML-A5]MSA08897.1 hypothetical protein [Lactonifactor sp. BIOML-A4]MSA14113.1 hypothetical protein [Lactonifactor sp. BIOML-A3]